MLEAAFEKILNMSLVGSYIVLIVLAVRFCVIKMKCGRKYIYYLWFAVFMNLCLPVSIKGSISLIPMQISQLSVRTLFEPFAEGDIVIGKDNDNEKQQIGDSDKQDSARSGNSNASSQVEKESNHVNGEAGNSAASSQAEKESNHVNGEAGNSAASSQAEKENKHVNGEAGNSNASGQVEKENNHPNGQAENSGIHNNIISNEENTDTALLQQVINFAGWVWLFGVGVIALRNLYCSLRLKKHLESRRHTVTDINGKLYYVEGIVTPILWGIVSPAIYLPFDVAEDEKEYIIAHELYHKKRGDHVVKTIVFCITVLHWFNPFVWAAYACFCRDMEISCDEAVLAAAKEDIRKRYAVTLLRYAAKQNSYALTPLAFGEFSLQSRIQNVLQYKKKGKLVSAAAILCIALIAAGLMLRPQNILPSEEKEALSGQHPNAGATSSSNTKEASSGQHTNAGTISSSNTEGASEEQLTVETVISSLDTITALPMGTVAEVDLDGDGVTELVRVSAMEENGVDAVSHQEMYRLLPMIQVDAFTFTPNKIRNLGLYPDDLDIATYYIFDLDTTDSYKEIGIYFEGYTVSPRTFLLRYKSGTLINIGCLEDIFPISSDQTHSAEAWAHELSTNPDANYQEMLDSVNRNELQLIVPGDGTITAKGYADYSCSPQDAFTQRTWELVKAEEFHSKLAERKLEMYEFEGWDEDKGERSVTTTMELQVYAAPSAEAGIITLPAGTKVSFFRYYSEGCWIQMAYEGYENFGYFQYLEIPVERNGTLCYEYHVVTPGGNYGRNEIFDCLYGTAGR